MPRTQLVSFGLALVLTVVATAPGCESDASSKVDEARIAYAQGRLDEARTLYEQALESEPDNAAALVGLANIHLDSEDIDAAAPLFTRLTSLDLDRQSEQLVDHARLRYDRLVYDRARGEGPLAPADREAYEASLISLYNLEASPQYHDELVTLFSYQARAALGVPDVTQPILPNSAYVADAGLDELRAALAAYQRLVERDERITRVWEPNEALSREAAALVQTIELAIFDEEFNQRFNSGMRSRLIGENRFDAERNMFRINFVSPEPYQGERPEGEALEPFQHDLALTLVIEEMTDLAYEAKEGVERGNNRPLQLGTTRQDVELAYAGVEVVSFEFSRDGIVTMEVLAPYLLLPRTAFRLEQYLRWLAEHPNQGSGVGTGARAGAGTGEGTGGGTGQGAGDAPDGGEGTGDGAATDGTGAGAEPTE